MFNLLFLFFIFSKHTITLLVNLLVWLLARLIKYYTKIKIRCILSVFNDNEVTS